MGNAVIDFFGVFYQFCLIAVNFLIFTSAFLRVFQSLFEIHRILALFSGKSEKGGDKSAFAVFIKTYLLFAEESPVMRLFQYRNIIRIFLYDFVVFVHCIRILCDLAKLKCFAQFCKGGTLRTLTD